MCNYILLAGLVIQSNQIREPAPIFKDKVVLVLGGSVTGADLACNALKSSAKKLSYIMCLNSCIILPK